MSPNSLETWAKRRDFVPGLLLGVLTFAVYMVGSSRNFGYDAAATFTNFVATNSIWDAFAVRSVVPTIPVTQVATNDHVLLSLISHVIFSLSGSKSEAVYRFVPGLAGGATVAVSTVALSRRFGLLAGICAGIFIAADPLFVDNSRDLRGYSLAALGSVIATVILAARWTRWRLVAYAVIMGLAITAQLFAGIVLVCHFAWTLTRRSRADVAAFLPAGVAAGVIGVAAYAGIYLNELEKHGLPPPYFYSTFPRDLVLFLLGAPVLLAVALWVPVTGLGLWTLKGKPWLWTTIAVVAVAVAVLWLGVQPAFLYPRFFIFLVPAAGYLMASAIQRWWVLAPVVVAGAVAAMVGEAPTYTVDPLALRQAAAAIDQVHSAGGQACVVHSDEQLLAGYTTNFMVVTSADQLSQCDAVVVVSWGVDLGVRDRAAEEFPRLTTLDAYYPAVVLER